MPVTPRGDASLALLHEVIDVQRPEGLADRPRIRVVQEVVDQRQRPQDVDLRALVIADDLFGDRKGLHDLPEEPDVHMLPGGFHRQVMQLLDREGLELRSRQHRLSLAHDPEHQPHEPAAERHPRDVDPEPTDRDEGRRPENDAGHVEGRPDGPGDRREERAGGLYIVEEHVGGDREREAPDHADDGSRDCGERPSQGAVRAEPFHPRRPQEDPEEARRERGPHRDDRADRPGHRGRERSRVPIRGEEAVELHDEDQRAGRGLREREPRHDVVGRQPEAPDHLVRHVGQHGVRTTERDHGHLGEEQAFLGIDRTRPGQRDDGKDGGPPHGEPHREDHEGPPPPRRRGRRPIRSFVREGHAEPPGSERQPRPGSGQYDDRERNADDEDREERERGQDGGNPSPDRPAADAHHRGRHDPDHRRREPLEDRGDDRELAARSVEPREAGHQDRCRRNEQHPGGDPSLGAVEEPTGVDRQLLSLGARQEQAEGQRVQEAVLAEPSAAGHQLLVHDRDLPGGPAEVHEPELQPEAERVAEARPDRPLQVMCHAAQAYAVVSLWCPKTPVHSADVGQDTLVIHGAREPNLRNITLELPPAPLIVFTGLSGSGKSSLAFDTIYAEGQRRYVESLSSYARQFLGQMEKPDVDFIEGLSPAISIDQKGTSKNPRSTVGTITEIYDYLRVLFARIGQPHCPKCGRPVGRQTPDQIVDQVMQLPEGTRFQVLAPIVRGRKGEYERLFADLARKGFSRARVDGEVMDLSEKIRLDRYYKHSIEVVVDRLVARQDIRRRVADSIETALQLAEGMAAVAVQTDGKEEVVNFSQKLACTYDGVSFDELAPRNFSFNSPYGACPTCGGLGTRLEVDPELVVPDPDLSIEEGAIAPWSSSRLEYWYRLLESLGNAYGFSTKTPWRKLSKESREAVMYGSDREIHITYRNRYGRTRSYYTTYEGVIPILERRYGDSESESQRERLEQFMREVPCRVCKGARLKP